MASAVDEALHELAQRLVKHRADRFPLEHAAIQFHIGTVLVQAARYSEAVRHLRTSADLFEREARTPEHAKALNMLGVALRSSGATEEAVAVFQQAVERFDAERSILERAAALFNLGLAYSDRDDLRSGSTVLEEAWDAFRAADAIAEAAAAGRELGAALLRYGQAERAAEVLVKALDLAERAVDRAAFGATANVLGLAHLALGRYDQATDSFRRAVAAHPRGVRPADYAMAKANAALAYERAGDAPRARLAAGQAAGTPAAARAVHEQAAGVLQRLGRHPDDLVAVLDEEPRDTWSTILREEVARLVDATHDERRRAIGPWLSGWAARPDCRVDIAEAWLAVLLEIPTTDMEVLLGAALDALAVATADEQEAVRTALSSALVRFHVPQWMRLRDTLDRLASDRGRQWSWR